MLVAGNIPSQRLVSDDDEISNQDSFPPSRLSHSASCQSRQNSSNCLNALSSLTDHMEEDSRDRDNLNRHVASGGGGGGGGAGGGSELLVRRSASGVFRYSRQNPYHGCHEDRDEVEKDLEHVEGGERMRRGRLKELGSNIEQTGGVNGISIGGAGGGAGEEEEPEEEEHSRSDEPSHMNEENDEYHVRVLCFKSIHFYIVCFHSLLYIIRKKIVFLVSEELLSLR
jgi:hypothetical protein